MDREQEQLEKLWIRIRPDLGILVGTDLVYDGSLHPDYLKLGDRILIK